MSLFRPGPVPPGVKVQAPSWPSLAQGAPAKTPDRAPTLNSPLPLDYGSHAEQLLNEARLDAAQVLQDAAAAAEAAMESARADGYAAGREEGIAAAQAELTHLRQQAMNMLDDYKSKGELIKQAAEAEAKARLAEADAQAQTMLAKARERAAELVEAAKTEQALRLDQSQEALVSLAVAAAIRLVQGHLALQPSSIATMVAAGIKRLKDADCTVRVSPHELPLLEAQRSTLERELGAGLLRIQADQGLGQGSFILTSPQGQIDARLDTQAQHLRAALDAALGGSSE